MTEAEYTAYYNKLISHESFLNTSTARAWIRADIRSKLLQQAQELRDDFYRIKRAEDIRR